MSTQFQKLDLAAIRTSEDTAAKARQLPSRPSAAWTLPIRQKLAPHASRTRLADSTHATLQAQPLVSPTQTATAQACTALTLWQPLASVRASTSAAAPGLVPPPAEDAAMEDVGATGGVTPPQLTLRIEPNALRVAHTAPGGAVGGVGDAASCRALVVYSPPPRPMPPPAVPPLPGSGGGDDDKEDEVPVRVDTRVDVEGATTTTVMAVDEGVSDSTAAGATMALD